MKLFYQKILVRYAADAYHSGAAARHEKGGGRMTYIENIFICMVSPLLVAALCMGRRQLRFFLFCIAGMGVCLLSAYINTFLAAVCRADALAATAEIAPGMEFMIFIVTVSKEYGSLPIQVDFLFSTGSLH